jgi:4-amino-4-deoxy-L-arabinose transferase-like glycosyltransferase
LRIWSKDRAVVPAAEADLAPLAALAKLRWHHLIVLGCLLTLGTFIRLDGITRTGLWGDEFQALFLATGRGDAVMNIPRNVIVDSPPPAGFERAPGIGHIWTSLDSTVQPPLYFIVLRLWVDAFGAGDFAIRAMSTLFCMLGVAALFNVIRWISGTWAGLLGAAMMAFAPVQLDFSQQARPYTLVTFLCLVMAGVLIRIEQKGPSPLRLILLFLATLTAAMTHYFALGTIAGCAAYGAIYMDGKRRRYALAVMLFGLLTFALAWGPILWSTRGIARPWMNSQFKSIYHLQSLWMYLLDLPQRLTLGTVPGMRWPSAIALAVLVYLVPPLKRGKAFIWYFWTLATIAAPLAVDLYTSANSMLVGMDKYVFLAAPAIYGILAAAMAGRIVATVVSLGVLIFGLARFQAGPNFAWASTWGLEDHRAQARFLAAHATPGDLVILPAAWSLNGDVNEASFDYFIIAHYAGPWKTPVLLLTAPIDDPTRAQLSRFHRVWVAGSSQQACARLLPGYRLIDVHGATFRDSVWAIK